MPTSRTADPTDYFPGIEPFDVYCPHLHDQLGPCAECDDPAYIAWCEDQEDGIDEQPWIGPDWDTRSREAAEAMAAADEPEPFAHIPTVVIP